MVECTAAFMSATVSRRVAAFAWLISHIRLTMRMPGMTFRPTVTVATPGQQLRWEGTLGGKKLFHGQHSFTLTANPDGTTRFTNHEEFSGVLVTLIGPMLPTPKNDGYATFNRGLKQWVESRI
ncbi:SRPBCC domain-containing protein [Micromonospora sp. M12]